MGFYHFLFHPDVEESFARFPLALQKRIHAKLQFFEQAKSPLSFAKRLHGTEEEIYRFRIGDYRMLVTPKNGKTIVILLILKIGHRKGVYE